MIEKTGEEIFDCKTISLKYIKGKFFIDLLASIPFDFFTTVIGEELNNNKFAFQLFGLLKLIRIVRLTKLITYLNLKDDLKMSLKLGKLIFYLIMYIHCVGCLWYYIVSQDQTWIPAIDSTDDPSEFYDSESFYKYAVSVYQALLVLTGNDITPKGLFQVIVVSVMLFAGSIINANIFGNLAVLLQQLNRKSNEFQEKVDNANSAMKNLAIPEDIQESVQKYLDYTQSTCDHQRELDRFLKMISPSLRELVIKHISQQAVSNNEIFRDKSEVLDLILPDLTTLLFTPEDYIIRQEEAAEFLYFICRGECEVLVSDEFQKEKYVKFITIIYRYVKSNKAVTLAK